MFRKALSNLSELFSNFGIIKNTQGQKKKKKSTVEGVAAEGGEQKTADGQSEQWLVGLDGWSCWGATREGWSGGRSWHRADPGFVKRRHGWAYLFL